MMQLFADTIADPVKFTQARDEAQNLAQWLARMTRSFTTPGATTADSALTWSRDARTLSTPEIAENTVLQLQLPDLLLHFAEHGKAVPHAIATEGKSSAEVEAWLLVEMLHRGFDRDRFTKDLPYRWPKLMSGDEVKYSPESLVAELRTLTSYFEQASTVLEQVRRRLSERLGLDMPWQPSEAAQPSASMAIGPESFDLGFSIHPTPNGGTPGAIGIGFTLGDDRDATPRFFVRPIGRDHRADDIFTLPTSRIKDAGMSVDDIVDSLVTSVARGTH